MESASELGNLLIISPHPDDAVFSCGEVLACRRSTFVMAMFDGTPPPSLPLTAWDAAAGFASTQNAMVGRREENMRALALLHVTQLSLDFVGSQYGDPPSTVGLAEAIADVLDAENPDTVMLPAGLYHTDHILTHQAALMARTRNPDRQWLMYEEMQYRLTGLIHFGIDATPVAFDTHAQAERKRHAMQCHASQLRALASRGRPGHGDIYAPEGYWRLGAA